ncbi:hypothetical protein SLS58_002607 [Diplodia intermedia]|uniref:Uncharacterized protein n=1 Tax=Diplodia intermedia TaxID=856260 RepID=A0ABR3TYX5_9PEZI
MKSHAEDMPVDGRVQAPTKRRSVAELAAQVMKDRPKSTTEIATSPPPMEHSSPEAFHQELPEETSFKVDSEELRDSSNVKDPEPEPEQGDNTVMSSLSNLARFYWSMLHEATRLYNEKRFRECHDLLLWTLEKAHVPLAVRCQLLQLLSLIVPIHLGLEYLDQAAEICKEMRRLIPSGGKQLDLTEEKNLRLQQRLIRAREAAKDDEDEEMIEDDESTDQDEEMAMDDGDAIEAKEGQTESQESPGIQQQSDLEMEDKELGYVDNIG